MRAVVDNKSDLTSRFKKNLKSSELENRANQTVASA